MKYNKNKFFLPVAIVFVALCAVIVIAGTILAPSTEIEPTGYTLADIHNLIANNIVTTSGNHELSTTSAPTATSTYSISEIYVELANLIKRENIKAGVRYLGVIGSAGNYDASRSTSTTAVVASLVPVVSEIEPSGYSLEDIWNLVSSGATTTEATQSIVALSEPEPSMHTTTDIYNALVNLIDPANLVSGVNYLGKTGEFVPPEFLYVSNVLGHRNNSGNGELRFPTTLYVDSFGNIFVVDTTNFRVQKFDSSGNYVMKFGTYGTGIGQFLGELNLAVDPSSGNIYVADMSRHIVQKFDSSGNYLLKIGSRGSTDGTFTIPSSVAIDSLGYVYVPDMINHIQKFDSSGNFVSKFGTVGSGDGQINQVFSITIDPQDNIYVSDTRNARVQKFSSTTDFLMKFGSSGSGDGKFNSPSGIAIDSSGNIFVVDSNNNRVQKFDASGNYVSQFGSFGTTTGKFNYPDGIFLDSSNNIYVADTGNNRIQKFDSSGSYLVTIGTQDPAPELTFSRPNGTGVDSAGNIYVADTDNHRVVKFDSAGNFIMQFGSSGVTGGKMGSIKDVAIDNLNNIYVVDGGSNMVHKFDPSGNFISKFGSAVNAEGSGDGQMYAPDHMAISSTTGNMYVLDRGNYRVEIFDSSGNYVSQFGSQGTTTGQFKLPMGIALDSLDNIYVSDVTNNTVQKFNSVGVPLFTLGSLVSTSSPAQGFFYSPSGIAVDSHDDLFVYDRAATAVSQYGRIQAFTSDGIFISDFTSATFPDTTNNQIRDLTIDSQDNIWATDSQSNRIIKINFY